MDTPESPKPAETVPALPPAIPERRPFVPMFSPERRALLKEGRLDEIRCNPMEDRCCRWFVITCNWRKSMILAGYGNRSKHDHKSREFIALLDGYGVKMKQRPWVRKRIQQLYEEFSARMAMSDGRLMGEISNLAESNIMDFCEVTEDGTGLEPDFGRMTRAQAAAIKEVEVEQVVEKGENGERQTVRKTKIKLHSKTTAQDMLMKQKGLYAKNEGSGGNPSVTILVTVEAGGKVKEIESVTMPPPNLPGSDGSNNQPSA